MVPENRTAHCKLQRARTWFIRARDWYSARTHVLTRTRTRYQRGVVPQKRVSENADRFLLNIHPHRDMPPLFFIPLDLAPGPADLTATP